MGDIFVTRDHFEQFLTHLMPDPLIVVLQKVYRILRDAKVSGIKFEPVTLLDEADDGLSCGHEYDELIKAYAANDAERYAINMNLVC